MSPSAQYEPEDQRLRPLTTADSTWWSVTTFIIKHRVPLGIGCAIVIIVSVGLSIWLNAQNAKRKAAGLALAAAKNAQEYESVIRDWAGSDAAAQAMFYLAHDQFTRGEYGKAFETYRSLLAQFPQHFLAASAQMGVAASLEAQGKTADAIVAFSDLLSRYPRSHHVAEANLGIGRCNETLGNWQKAKEAYEMVLTQSASWADQAHERLIVVKRHIKPVPLAIPTPTSTLPAGVPSKPTAPPPSSPVTAPQ